MVDKSTYRTRTKRAQAMLGLEGFGRRDGTEEGRDRIARDGCLGDEYQLDASHVVPAKEWHLLRTEVGGKGGKGLSCQSAQVVRTRSEWFLSAQPLYQRFFRWHPMCFACLATLTDGVLFVMGRRMAFATPDSSMRFDSLLLFGW